ncbi:MULTISPECIES: hypothetical protein [Zhongshania]|uniref:ABC-type nickel/cobalt efflux system permease component RcnA n=1 Tax=Zhongshania antarctica TaxID=641702 RepID=A0A840QYQ5_9GAMM|nr:MULTISPECIES: hypothetical protein [Zhongshania]MBB5185845.1 ABC-type nickel/cobalt efflux system permease component RcnA [Zhongshania antarctica]
MKLSTSLVLIAGLAFAVNSYADHQRGDSEFEARYRYSNGKGHDRHAYKHHHDHHDVYYVRDDHHDHHDRYHDRYYVRHVHSRHCGHHYEPAFNTRVKVFLGI